MGRAASKRWRGAQRVWQYQWNSDSRLTQLTTPEGQIWRYSYDAFGRRLAKREAAPEGQSYIEIQYLWDGNVLAEEVRLRHTPQADGSLLSETLKSLTWDYEPNTWRPLSQTETRYSANQQTGRHTYAILTDHLGTPKELLDQNGEIAWAASGDLWGVSEAQKGAATDCPIRFQGQYFDEESQLAYNCQRYYDPSTGRYLSNDPLGLAGGPDPHAYVPNPLAWVDPLGLQCSTCPKPGDGPHTTGIGKPPETAAPNSIYTKTDRTGAVAVQNTIYDSNGIPIAQVDFKNHGSGAVSGHAHVLSPPGDFGSAHGPSAPHLPPGSYPAEWSKLPTGVSPANPIGG